jgi:hypothetical protein
VRVKDEWPSTSNYDPRRHPLGQEEAGCRVPAVVEAMVAHAGGLLEPGEAVRRPLMLPESCPDS